MQGNEMMATAEAARALIIAKPRLFHSKQPLPTYLQFLLSASGSNYYKKHFITCIPLLRFFCLSVFPPIISMNSFISSHIGKTKTHPNQN
jgi:hypothetical protein